VRGGWGLKLAMLDKKTGGRLRQFAWFALLTGMLDIVSD
jgi:hypothetical protein